MKFTQSLLLITLGFLLTCASCKKEAQLELSDDDTFVLLSNSPVPQNIEDFHRLSLNSEITNVQPFTGLVFWTDRARELDASYRQSIAMEYVYVRPCDYVTGKSGDAVQYNWQSLDALLEDVASRNHQAILRFFYEYPGNHFDANASVGATSVPNYIKAMSDYHETYNADAGGDGPTYYADWSHAELQWFTRQFITDFAARYDRDARIALIQIGFGHWSEYHIYGTPLNLGVNFPSKAYQTAFLQHVSSTFHTIPWCISIDAADEEYSPIAGQTALMNLPFGLFDDSFMHAEHEILQGDGYNENCWLSLNYKNRSQYAPCGGEISYYEANDQYNFLSPSGIHGYTWESAASKYNISYMIANDAPDGNYATPERVKSASLATGYHFIILDFITDGTTSWIKIANKGNAPISHDAYVVLNGKRSTFSLRQLPSGYAVWLSFDTNGDGATPTIQCDALLPQQQIEFDAHQ